ncbi:MAG TPA: GMC family oxidoreductase [Candidatus Acidoferrales bacterium]|nr:GMC family oxidoreductase [Candidatus Acidoferrales bacterium]
MTPRSYDVVIIGSGAGGGTVAQELSPLCRDGVRIAVLEKGPKLRAEEFTGRELEMAQALYEDGGGFLTAERTMTLAFGSAYGGSTAVYTGTSLEPPQHVLERWNVPELKFADVQERARKFAAENNVHLLEDGLINENNRLFVEGCRRLKYRVQQFPVNLKGCRGSSLCNLGCPNQAKQGTDRVQLPRAEGNGAEVVTRCEVLRLGERTIAARVHAKPAGAKGEPSSWEPGEYEIDAKVIVVCAGAVHSPALLMRSGLARRLPRLGHGFTCHPAIIMVAEHDRAITNFVGHPKSYYLDQFAESDRFLLETCMYFPFVTAKAMSGFGPEHSRFMRAFPRLQMILVLACDEVHAQNRVTIDSAGRPVVHYRFAPEVMHGLVQGAVTSARIFFAAGAARVHLPVGRDPTMERADTGRLDQIAQHPDFKPGKLPVSAAHLQGGCAMGRGPEDSVTDGWGRVHGIPWLFVADASLFPNSLEINPYLTIMALADRVAEVIREEAHTLL